MPNPLRESSPEEVFTAFHFAVEINVPGVAPRLCRAAFAECEGLGLIMHARTIREGGNREREIHLLGSRSYGQVTLKRGMTASFDLWNWVDAFLTADHDGLQDTLRSDVEVVLLAPDGRTERARFLLRRCLPVLLKAPTLNAKDGAVAIEELQLVYESLALKRPGVAHPSLSNREARGIGPERPLQIGLKISWIATDAISSASILRSGFHSKRNLAIWAGALPEWTESSRCGR